VMEQKLPEFIKEVYGKVDAIVSVMATGITIRAVAPHLNGKLSDPAVIGVDASGRFVISLLSGHYGGANELTRVIAECIDATAVITTTSDVLGKQSVDELARAMHLTILNPESLVGVNSALVNGGQLGLVVVGAMKTPADTLQDYAVKQANSGEEALEILKEYDAGAIITRKPLSTTGFPKPVTVLEPKKIVVGLGSRKNITEHQIIQAIEAALEQAKLPMERVDALATVDLKKDSEGMLSAAQNVGLKFEYFSVPQLRAFTHPELSPDSELVQEKIGVGGVCEQAALMAAGKNSHLILKKQKRNGVTVAVAEGE
jgi:cobalt-precorrin 5A hydrolase